MPGRQWFIATDGNQQGPFSDARIRELIAAGTVHADTPVWCEGMSDWTKAGDIPGLIPQSLRPPPPPRSAGAPEGGAQGFAATVGVWALLGRVLLLCLCQLVIIPFPWAVAHFSRWFVAHIVVPGGRRVTFTGKAADIWYVFVLYALCAYADLALSFIGRNSWLAARVLPLLVIPATAFLGLMALRWFYANLAWEGRVAPLHFTGGFWAMLGWSLLVPISVVSIIGWAWVYTAWGRWMCRHVEGAQRRLSFTATGLGYLWRTVVFALSCILIVPIPWTLRWYVGWIVSQFALA